MTSPLHRVSGGPHARGRPVTNPAGFTNLVNLRKFDKFRVVHPVAGVGDGTCGCFDIGPFRIIASAGGGWDHVSVSRQDRAPTWQEMETVFRGFFRPGSTAMQLHVPEEDHVNVHPFCLHIWAPNDPAVAGGLIPRPPRSFVG